MKRHRDERKKYKGKENRVSVSKKLTDVRNIVKMTKLIHFFHDQSLDFNERMECDAQNLCGFVDFLLTFHISLKRL